MFHVLLLWHVQIREQHVVRHGRHVKACMHVCHARTWYMWVQVYKAMRAGVQPVAVKVLRDPTEKQLSAFAREVSILQGLRDHNVVQFLGVCYSKGRVMLVTEFMQVLLCSACPLSLLCAALTSRHLLSLPAPDRRLSAACMLACTMPDGYMAATAPVEAIPGLAASASAAQHLHSPEHDKSLRCSAVWGSCLHLTGLAAACVLAFWSANITMNGCRAETCGMHWPHRSQVG